MRALSSNMVPHHGNLLSATHTPLWQHEHTLFFTPILHHSSIHTWTNATQADLTPTTRCYIFAPPLLSLMGAIPVAMGCARCRKVLKSRRLFPVNLVWSLYVVVQMFWGEVCRRCLWRGTTVARGQRQEGLEKETRQPAGHRSRLPQVTVCLNYFHIPHKTQRNWQ